MRALIALLASVAGLAAQVSEPDASAKLKQFEQNLEKAMRPAGGKVSVTLARPGGRVCAIPLLKVRPDASFKSNMPVIAPDPKIDFSIHVVTPPAASCDERQEK
jgi:hypothetical protein